MIHTLGSKKFDLSPHKFCFGLYDHLELRRSNMDENATIVNETADIIFRRTTEPANDIRLWVPVK